MSWGDLDKLGVAKPRPDGGPTLVAIDERPLADIGEAKLVSILVAMAKVARGKYLLAERHAGKGVVAYVTKGTPSAWLIEAVSAAGGVLFDGTREHSIFAGRPATMVLDETLCDLAIAVRRRLKVSTFGDALELREAELRRAPLAVSQPLAYWSAVYELMGLAGEMIRAVHAGRYLLTDQARIPFALDMGKQRRVLLGRAAEAITGGDAATLRTTVATAEAWWAPPPPPALASTHPVVPYLTVRDHPGLARAAWEPLVPAIIDADELPVVAYVEDRGDTVAWNVGRPLGAALRDEARANLDAFELALELVDVGELQLVAITGAYATEAMFHRTTMQKVVIELGTDLLLLGVPSRGNLFAIDAASSSEVQRAFHSMMERLHAEADADLRLSTELILFRDVPLGRAQTF